MTVSVDKVVISLNLKSNNINLKELKKDKAVIISNLKEPYTVFKDISSNKDVYLNYLKLSKSENRDIIFNALMIGTSKNQYGQWISYCKLDMTLPNILGRTNEKCISDDKELKSILDIVQRKLNQYGLDTDVKTALIQEIEINSNIDLTLKFKEYEYVCEYMKSLISPMLKTDINQSYAVNDKGYSGFKVGNNSRNLKYYDKKKALYKVYGIDIQREILRIEYRFRNSTTVKNYLGFNHVGELIEDNFISVRKAYKSMFLKDIYEPLKEDISKQMRAIEKELKSQKRMNLNAIIDKKPFDIELILAVLKKINRNGNAVRDSKRVIDTMYKKELNSSALVDINRDYYFNNLNKINEILVSLDIEKIEFKLSKSVQKKLTDTIKMLEK